MNPLGCIATFNFPSTLALQMGLKDFLILQLERIPAAALRGNVAVWAVRCQPRGGSL